MTSDPLRVLIAGGGVAALETMIALRDLAGQRVTITLLAPDEDFVYMPMSVEEPFAKAAPSSRPLAAIAGDFDAELRHDTLGWVAPRQRAAFTTAGAEIEYDALVLTLGARRERPFDHVTTFTGREDAERVHGLVQDVEEGYSNGIIFVVPPGVTWPLPLYELALMLAARSAEMGVEPTLTFVTPEESPLAVFGTDASAGVGAMLNDAGITVVTSGYASVQGANTVIVRPSGDVLTADRIVTVPTLHGTAPRGIPADADGFIPTDGHGRLNGVPDIYAAGDGTTFPVKQGGIATQQADAIAELIAKRAGASLEPRSFRPVMRSMLLTGGKPVFLRGEVSRGRDGISEVSDHPLWWPPTKIAGRYLAPYLAGDSSQHKGITHEADVDDLHPAASA
jgi:sulfide:quinone oxidoreductase